MAPTPSSEAAEAGTLLRTRVAASPGPMPAELALEAVVIDEHFVWLGVLINFIGGAWYAVITLRAHTQPNPVSWGLWSLTGWIAVGGQLAEGAGLEVLLTVTVAAIPTMIAVASLVARMTRSRGTYEPITRLDLTCAGLALLTLLIWWITASGVVAIALSIAVDALPAFPVLLQAVRSPKSDHPSIWVAGTISAVITLLTLEDFGFASAGFAIYFLILCASMTFLLLGLPALRLLAPPRRTPAATTPGKPAAAAAFAAAFAADYLSWDESDPGRRGDALTAYFDGIPPQVLARFGWSGAGRQRVEFVLVGETTLDDRARTVAVDVRVRFTPYVRTGPRVSRRTLDPPVLRAALAAAGRPAAAPPAATVGWAALGSRWTRLLVAVEDRAGRLTIVRRPPGNEATPPIAYPHRAPAAFRPVVPLPHLVAPPRRSVVLGGRQPMTMMPPGRPSPGWR